MRSAIALFLSFLMLFVSSCVPYRDILNYEQAPAIPTAAQLISNTNPITIQSDDILHINVAGSNPVALQAFVPDQGGTVGNNNPQSLTLNGYLVDSKGNIDFPTLGSISVLGLTLEETKEKVQRLLQPYFEEQLIINVRLLNFRINVNGEITSPGTFTVTNPSVSIIEALTMAGDFTDYSRRDSILIIREENGERTFGYVNFNNSDIFSSPYFYLQQNDVVYVQPAKRKLAVVRDPITRVFTFTSAITGIAAFIISIIRLR